AGLEVEIALGEGADGTDVYHVRRVAIVQLMTGADADLGVVAAIEDAELAGLGDLVGEAHTAGAEDASLLVEHDMRPERHGLVLLHLLFAEARIVQAEVEVEILQVAFARLVADGTVERMVGEQELQHGL